MDTLTLGMPTMVTLITLALAFSFLNGFHDAANSIATIVSTRVLKPQHAVMWAAFFNFAALFVFHRQIAATVGTGIVDPNVVDQFTIFGALIGAIAWNLLTWWRGIPSSASHALIGGLLGATLIAHGPSAILAGGLGLLVLFIVLAPVLGFLIGSVLMLVSSILASQANPRSADRLFRRMQLVSSALYSLGHGSNDAQKTMGIIWLILIAAGRSSTDTMPDWVGISCYLAIALGTLFGGWRIVRTMGQRLTKLRPVGGFSAESGGALTLFITSAFGIPVSTTHIITSSIVGVGAVGRRRVRWGLASHIVWVWLVTIPASACIAALGWWLARLAL